MEIESKRDHVDVTLPRAEAEALYEAADDGIRIIEALALVKVISTTERAHKLLSAAIGKRGANVTVTLHRTEAAALQKAGWTGWVTIRNFDLPREHAAARRAIDKLGSAVAKL